MNAGMTHNKSDLRRRLEQLRSDLPAEERQNKSQLICDLMTRHYLPNMHADSDRPFTVFTYIPFRAEVNVIPFVEQCWDKGVRVAVPRIADDGAMDVCIIRSFDDLQAGSWGIREPEMDTQVLHDLSEISLIVVPGVAFDRRGGRLGYGGGYYDRFLARYVQSSIPIPLKLAVAFDVQIVPEVPMEPHDIRVDQIITESGPLMDDPQA